MAEFQEVMKQFHRMCKFYQSKRLCPMGCPMDGLNVSQCRKQITDAYDDVEYLIMKWAAEHPEPKYPTFAEWLNSIGVIIGDVPLPLPNIPVYVYQAGAKMFEPIPSDIAEKLGIEPKEDNDAK